MNLGKTLLSIPATIMVGILGIVEILFEVIYQISKLLRRGFKLFSKWVLKLLKPMYVGKWKAQIKEDDKDKIEIVTFDYEIEEEGLD